jgi:hypothetical protein
MRIEYDYDFHADGTLAATHFVDTDDPLVEQTLAGLDAGTIDMTASGWGVISRHPDYSGKTRYEVVKAEMARRGGK